jgi:hypothetical protein
MIQELPEKDLAYLRIEEIGKYFSVRIGIFEDRVRADTFLQKIKSLLPAALKLKAHIKADRIIKMYRDASSVNRHKPEDKEVTDSKTHKTGPPKHDKSGHQTISEIYTIETGSFINYDDAQKTYDSMVQGANTRELAYDLSYLRIEKKGENYSVRIGKFRDRGIAQSFLKAMKTRYPAAEMITDSINDERIIKKY